MNLKNFAGEIGRAPHYGQNLTRRVAFGSGFKTVEEMGKEELSRGIYPLKRCFLLLPAVTICFF